MKLNNGETKRKTQRSLNCLQVSADYHHTSFVSLISCHSNFSEIKLNLKVFLCYLLQWPVEELNNIWEKQSKSPLFKWHLHWAKNFFVFCCFSTGKAWNQSIAHSHFSVKMNLKYTGYSIYSFHSGSKHIPFKQGCGLFQLTNQCQTKWSICEQSKASEYQRFRRLLLYAGLTLCIHVHVLWHDT